MTTGYDIATDILDYGELLVHSVGTILEIRRASDIRYLSAYLKLLDAEYKGEQYSLFFLTMENWVWRLGNEHDFWW